MAGDFDVGAGAVPRWRIAFHVQANRGVGEIERGVFAVGQFAPDLNLGMSEDAGGIQAEFAERGLKFRENVEFARGEVKHRTGRSLAEQTGDCRRDGLAWMA